MKRLLFLLVFFGLSVVTTHAQKRNTKWSHTTDITVFRDSAGVPIDVKVVDELGGEWNFRMAVSWAPQQCPPCPAPDSSHAVQIVQNDAPIVWGLSSYSADKNAADTIFAVGGTASVKSGVKTVTVLLNWSNTRHDSRRIPLFFLNSQNLELSSSIGITGEEKMLAYNREQSFYIRGKEIYFRFRIFIQNDRDWDRLASIAILVQ